VHQYKSIRLQIISYDMNYIQVAIWNIWQCNMFCILFIHFRYMITQCSTESDGVIAWYLKLNPCYRKLERCRGLLMYTTASTFSSIPSTSLAVHANVSQVWPLLLTLHIGKHSNICLISYLSVVLNFNIVLFLELCVILRRKQEFWIIKKYISRLT